ncbi:RbsD/FucU family protein [Pseudolysinimonas kribbensis]|uniref:RbsD or FucU transporter n=1 Tax=Pseudolysinimonas kribbensis TaxID=433641 RepID=A0ABQ6K4H6_9MICO|nr:RbsD/FucU domain-containing protein [Pseudolysinimonas kribbensis]GMA94344.1 RbsD or FucU transporter [Pseudolysinimonas kribbensis]
MTLKGIDPLLSGELLQALDELGHGDLVVVADRNFPAHTQGAPVVRIDAGVVDAMRAILSVFPLDTFVEQPLERMVPEDGTGAEPGFPWTVPAEVIAVAAAAEQRSLTFRDIPRMAFYERAKQAHLIVLTRETAPYCDFVLTKGVV